MKLALHLTHDCNLRCSYCYVGKKYHRTMSQETAEMAVRFGFAESTQWLDINFFGGEPLLEKERLFQTIAYAKKYQKEQSITKPLRFFTTTNGVGLDEEFILAAKEKDLEISLSLDGCEEGHDLTRRLPEGGGSYTVIRKNFPAILTHLPNINILMTFSPLNVHLLADGLRRLHKEGFRLFFIGPDFECGWSEKQLEELKKQYQLLGEYYETCLRSNSYLYIDLIESKIATQARSELTICSCCNRDDGEIAVAPSGNLYPCLRFVKEDEGGELLLGSVQLGLDRKKRAKIMVESSKEWPACKECVYQGRCFHYCGAVNYKITGSFNQPPAALCIAQQTAIHIADQIGKRLYHEQEPNFMRRFYGVIK